MHEEDVDSGETSGDSTQVSEIWDGSLTNSSRSSFSELDLFFVEMYGEKIICRTVGSDTVVLWNKWSG